MGQSVSVFWVSYERIKLSATATIKIWLFDVHNGKVVISSDKNDNKDVNNDDNSRGVNHFFHERLLIKSQPSMPEKGTVLKAKTK